MHCCGEAAQAHDLPFAGLKDRQYRLMPEETKTRGRPRNERIARMMAKHGCSRATAALDHMQTGGAVERGARTVIHAPRRADPGRRPLTLVCEPCGRRGRYNVAPGTNRKAMAIMEQTPLPISLDAARKLPWEPGRSAEVFVDGEIEVRFTPAAQGRHAAHPRPRRTLLCGFGTRLLSL